MPKKKQFEYVYVYMTINLVNGKEYIGVHGTYNFLKDNYIGSGIALKHAINKHGRDNFRCIVLEWFDKYVDALVYEKNIVTLYYCKQNDNYNLAIGGNGGCVSEVSGHKISVALTGIPKTLQHRKKLSESHQGLKHSYETKKKMRYNNVGDKNPMYGVPSPMTGKRHKKSTKKLQSLCASRRIGELNHMYGKKLTDKHKSKISIANKGKKRGTGKWQYRFTSPSGNIHGWFNSLLDFKYRRWLGNKDYNKISDIGFTSDVVFMKSGWTVARKLKKTHK